MRTFTGVPDDLLLAVVPGSDLSRFVESLQETTRANAAMQEFYDAHQSQFAGAAGQRD